MEFEHLARTGGLGLREQREAAGLTRAELADLSGCGITSLANIEQGCTPKRSRVLDRALEALAVYVDAEAAVSLETGGGATD